MFTCHPTVAEPAWMALLALLPVLWWRSYRRLGRLGRARRRLVLVLRTLAIALLVLAAAGFEIVRSNDRLTVIYLLDQSLSIPQSQRAAMLKCARDEVRAHRRDEDRAGMIVFGREAAIELPPWTATCGLAARSRASWIRKRRTSPPPSSWPAPPFPATPPGESSW